MLGAKKRPQGTYDSDLLLKANYAVTAIGTPETNFGLDGAGGAAIVVEVGTGLFKGCCIVDISAIETGGVEEYHLTVQGGVLANFANSVPLATLSVGDPTNIIGLSAVSTPGRYKIYFDNEVNGTYYPFIRLQIVTVAGTENATFAAYVVPIQ